MSCEVGLISLSLLWSDCIPCSKWHRHYNVTMLSSRNRSRQETVLNLVFLKIEWKTSPLSIRGTGNLYISLLQGFTIYVSWEQESCGIHSFSILSLKKRVHLLTKEKKLIWLLLASPFSLSPIHLAISLFPLTALNYYFNFSTWFSSLSVLESKLYLSM